MLKSIQGWLGVVVVGLAMGSAAQASGIDAVRFEKMELDSKLRESMKIEGASLQVDSKAGKVHLQLERGWECRQDFCATVMPEPIQVSLSIQAISQDRCGRRIIQAESARTLDLGARQSIVIIDLRNSVCGGQDPHALTEATLETRMRTSEGEQVQTRSHFSGPALEGMPQILPIEDEVTS